MPAFLSSRIRWALEPVPWRGLTVMSISTVAFLFVTAVAFIEGIPKFSMVVIYPLALLSWLIGVLGLVGHFRWFFSGQSRDNE